MKLKQRNFSIGEYLAKKGYNHIAIYGMSFMGHRLQEELSDYIAIDYAIDQNADSISTNINVYLPSDNLEEVDAVIVTTIMYFDEIKRMLYQKIKCPILSLENIIMEISERQDE